MHEGRTGADTINILMQRRYGRPATEAEIEQIYAEKCRLFNACPTAGKMEGADMVLARVKAASPTSAPWKRRGSNPTKPSSSRTPRWASPQLWRQAS